jgi:serine protease inhibitor
MNVSLRPISIVLALCVAPVPNAAGGERPKERQALAFTANARILAKGNTAFALDLYVRLREDEGNLFFSPHSISAALGMTYAGSRGDTASQMRKVLHFRLDRGRLHPAFRNLTSNLEARQRKGKLELSVANALWGQKGLTFVKDFAQGVRKHHDAELRTVDFAGSTESARQTINAWVENRTRGRIKELFQRGVLNRVTALVLANAVYFKGSWAAPFDKGVTREAPFTLSKGKKVRVPMMYKEDEFGFLDQKTFKAVALPYADKELTMVIFLPNKFDGLPDLERSLTLDHVTKCFKELSHREVKVYLPRFRISSAFRLDTMLKAMGMKDLFAREKADLSGMIDPGQVGGPVYVQAVVHKAFVDVNEEGTEAAAATGVAVAAESEPMAPVVFRADHSFIFMIRDRRSGSILFMGRVTNPAERED